MPAELPAPNGEHWAGQGRAGKDSGAGPSHRKVSTPVISHIWHQLDKVLTGKKPVG